MSAEPLPNSLQNLLSTLPDRDFAARFAQLHSAATAAITKLQELDTASYETVSDGLADLSVWEALAPALGQTIMDVNGFLQQARELFPVGMVVANTPVGNEVEQALSTAQIGLNLVSQEIPKLGETMRNPEVVSNRWALISELQTFRARFRDLIGGVLYEVATCFGEINRKDVVPGFAQQLKNAVSLRATSADLGRLLKARRQKLAEAETQDMQWHTFQMEKELAGFSSTAAYRSLRAQDKKGIIELREKLRELSQQQQPAKLELAQLVIDLEAWVQSLAEVNRRQILLEHDRETWAAVGVRLERVATQLRDPAAAGKTLTEAAALAQSLYGRDNGLDAFLRRAKKTPLAALPPPELKAAYEELRELIANLPVFD